MSEQKAVRVATLLLALSLYAVMFDQWWHVSFGRDSFGIPPHFLVYSVSACLILFSWYAFSTFKNEAWRQLAIVMAILPASAPFDNFWHGWFGIEQSTSVWVAWSPPHVVLTVMFMLTELAVLRLIRTYETNPEVRKLLSIFVLALLLSSFTFLTLPLQPFYYFHLLGLYGFILTMPIPALLTILSRREFGFAGATLFTLFFQARVFAGSGESLLGIAPFSPIVVSVAPVLFAALVLDLMPRRMPIITQALMYGVLLAISKVVMFFMFSIGLIQDMDVAFRMNYFELTFATIAGCFLGGLLLVYVERRLRSFVHPSTEGVY